MSTGQTMSITQALAELKLLRKRLDTALEDAHFVRIVTKKLMVNKQAFETHAKASLQKYHDLLDRYNKIKSAIVQSNAVAIVTIGDKTYTVAEAVERKRSITYEKTLLTKLQGQWMGAKGEYERHQELEHARVERLLSAELSKDSKTNVDVVQALTKTFLEEGKAEMLDPLHIETVIREMRTSIDDFLMNVDWILSEANGRTLITVS
jgi:hypothetical protein